MIKITPQLSSVSQEAFNLEAKRKLGERKENKIIYSKYEALYLIESKKAELTKDSIKLNTQEKLNYIVFRDLTKKALIVKTGLKFGVEFRVYKNKNQHACWLVQPIKHSEKLNMTNLIAKNRIAHSTGKRLLLAIVDSQEDISYYEFNWIKI
ncbi:MAG: tRNA-intron lyase [Candidatus Pacearchaeota archaeon]